MSPYDADLNLALMHLGPNSLATHSPEKVLVTADGHVSIIDRDLSENTLRALISINGGEKISDKDF